MLEIVTGEGVGVVGKLVGDHRHQNGCIQEDVHSMMLSEVERFSRSRLINEATSMSKAGPLAWWTRTPSFSMNDGIESRASKRRPTPVIKAEGG